MVKHALETGEPLRSFVERGVGKTTGAILLALGESYQKPGEWVEVRDPT